MCWGRGVDLAATYAMALRAQTISLATAQVLALKLIWVRSHQRRLAHELYAHCACGAQGGVRGD